MVEVAISTSRGEAAFTQFEVILDTLAKEKGEKAERATAGILEVVGGLAGHLEKASLKKMLVRFGLLFVSESDEVRSSACLAVASALKDAIAKGTIAADGEPAQLLTSSLETLAKANTPEESRTASCGLGAAIGALGEMELSKHDVVKLLGDTMETKSKTAANAREAATLAVGMLSLSLGFKFEPYSIPMLSALVKLIVDKDKKVADAAASTLRIIYAGVSTLTVKVVLPALYEGMQVVGGGGRSKIECLQLATQLAARAPRTMGPCLPECIPLVMECLNDSNAKVQNTAEEALQVMITCTENAEVASTLKSFIIEALGKPDKTQDCIDEVMMTTFCNPMDGTSLAFMMPIVLRGIRDANYALVKKATVCTGNLCALIKESSDIAPFLPVLQPLLEKNLEHSSPDVREATVIAKTKLEEGAGGLVDPEKRPKAIRELVATKVAAIKDVPAAVSTYIGATVAAMLEEKLGSVVRVQYFKDAVGLAADWLESNLSGIVTVNRDSLTAIADSAVELFKDMLSEVAKSILADSGDKDFALDIQNIILAFAGRVLLRKADIRFERGHRYGLVGQNGTGKTTLLNRLAAKDITGFPQHLRTHYIRHHLDCEDGILVRDFLKSEAPEHMRTDAVTEDILDRVQFPAEFRDTQVTSLSGGWKMRMLVAISILHEPQLLLLDEPTNHLDRDAIDWLTAHLLSLKGVTMAVVSHDYDFVDAVCSDVTHYDNGGELGKPCKFVYYPMRFHQFQILKPEVAAGLPQADKGVASTADVLAANRTPSEVSEASERSADDSLSKSMETMSVTSDSERSDMSASLSKIDEMIAQGLVLPMRFPDPGKPEGIRTFRKPIMTLKNVNFKYPTSEKYILEKVTSTLTLGSRAVIVGGNGSGKSTCLKLLIGDLEPEEGSGEVWKHHNLRLAYVAQQSLHHLEDYLTQTPIHYIQERFRQGLDAEVSKLKTLEINDEDREEIKKAGSVNEILGRQQRGRALWYELQLTGRMKDDTKWVPLSELEGASYKPYVKKLIKNYDMKAQALESGMAVRPVTAAEILAHLADFGVDSQLAHGKIRQMSGGQRQRLVISAAFWSKPHVIALDEPTNYLDNDSVAALTKALKDFKGAVLCVSENEAFVNEISNEKWVVENGAVTMVQLRDAKAR
uniref:Elongation factor 3 n=1 Tax=Haptolina brevifila TaxID=156173 RepID=A0A7S2CNH5_9EUKA